MDTESSSVTASRDGHATRQGESVFDEYDEISNATVGIGSPVAHPGAKSPQSDSKSRVSGDLVTVSYEGSTTRVHHEPPQQLALNNHNLHGFTRRVETGKVPLRLDVIPDDAYVAYGSNLPKLKMEKNVDEPGDVSVMTRACRTLDAGDLGSDVADSATQYSNASLRGGEMSMEGNTWNIEGASVDPQVGSPTRHHTDPLNSANLSQHMLQLSRGPAPLRVENIVVSEVRCLPPDGNVSVAPALPDTAAASLMAESSELDAMSTSEVMSLTRNRSAKPASVGDTMDDMWSTTSTRGFDTMYFNSGGRKDGTLHALSKENLRQLRHQLESGETPLRPEVLAGLSTMVQAMAQTNSTQSASTAVEPTMTEGRSKLVESAACPGSSSQSFAEARAPFLLDSTNASKDCGPSVMAPMSFRGPFADAPTTEACEGRAGASSEYPKKDFLRSKHVDLSDRDVDEEGAEDEVGVENEDEEEDESQEKPSTSDDSCDGQNESIFNVTEDDGIDDMTDPAAMSRHMRELFKLVQEGRQDQSHLRQLVLEQRSVIEHLQSTVKGLESELSALKRH
ncbi:hypothetical protein LSCM1_02211 [Leishmania martiniquensis]|uniref:Uncharacterized protein n=1 Tax=Leishmania martiniquensis TaxID=1580590 RepID=A0A836KJQ8_9TRYP|nr:hypothetical protein LSCM1_02211 [Leishmania martiniquensis]